MSVIDFNQNPELQEYRAVLLDRARNLHLHKLRSRAGRDILCHFTKLVDMDGRFRRSVKALKNETGYSVTTIRQQISVMEALGIVECVRCFDEDSYRPATNEYILNLPPIDDDETYPDAA